MPASIFDEIRAACAAVARDATHVRIAEERVASYAASLPLERAIAPALDPRYHYLEEPEGAVAFVITLDAINFGSGYFPHLRKRPGLSGYFTVAASLTERFRDRGPFTAEELAGLSTSDCARLFGQELDGGPVDALMGLFAAALNELGRYLLAEFPRGRFMGLAEAAHESAEKLVRRLAEMRFFRDVEQYRGREVPFYKRAQLTAADLALALHGEGVGHFTDLDQLTIFADNLVPHVLRVDGVLRYEEGLVARIEAGELIPAGSEEEIEIRGCALHAVELVAAELRRAGHVVTASGLDYLLWNRGQEPAYKAIPRHRTRTVYY